MFTMTRERTREISTVRVLITDCKLVAKWLENEGEKEDIENSTAKDVYDVYDISRS